MTDLTNKSFFSLLRSAHKILAEDAEAERERASENLYTRLKNIEIQKVLDDISDVLYNGSYTPTAKLEAVIGILNGLGFEDDDYEDDESDEIDLGGKTKADLTPST